MATAEHGKIDDPKVGHDESKHEHGKITKHGEDTKISKVGFFASFASKHKITELALVSEVVQILSTESPVQGFQKLVEKRILSAPVLDAKTKQYAGFLDVKDFVSFMLFYTKEMKKQMEAHDLSSVEKIRHNFEEIIKIGAKFHSDPLSCVGVTYLCRRHPFRSSKSTDSLANVLAALAEGVHRVPILSDDGTVSNIISQSAVLTFIHENRAELGPVLDKKLSEVKIGTRPVVCVPETASAFDTFQLMSDRNLSGVAVVNKKGQLVGNTSGSDMKLFLQHPSPQLLSLPISDYLARIRRENIKTVSPVVSVSTETTVGKLIAKLVATRMHRVFVVNSETKAPEAVIAITDILRCLLHE